MFTGIVTALGTWSGLTPRGSDARVRIAAGALDLGDVKIGDSIAVSGVCLTVVALAGDGFEADVSAETFARTTFRRRRVGDRLNLEKALAVGERLGGHFVSGHVDGVGRLAERAARGDSLLLRFDVPAALARYVAEKGSICVDGVSLTVNRVDGARFDVNLVPHTRAMTTLEYLQAGDEVNLEVDLLARYLERLVSDRAR